MLRRLWKKVRVDGDCWVWTGCKRKRYGTVNIGGVMKQAHRVMYEQLRGPIPDGLELDHLCSNPACVNPWHLEPVTHAENIRRGANAKLDAAAVRSIREMASSGLWLQRELGEIWGVSKGCISSIARGVTWQHA